jgi:malate dehydrogenase
VGNPANTNCLIAKHYAPSIPSTQWSALTRLDQNRARSEIAVRCKVLAEDVKNIIIWGNHSTTQFPDCSVATVNMNGATKKVTDVCFLFLLLLFLLLMLSLVL